MPGFIRAHSTAVRRTRRHPQRRLRRRIDSPFRFTIDDVGPAAKCGVQLDHFVRCRTLLRCSDPRRAQRAVQRVVHIDGESE